MSRSITEMRNTNRQAGLPEIKLPDFKEKVERIKTMVELEIRAKEDPNFNKAQELMAKAMKLKSKAVNDAEAEGPHENKAQRIRDRFCK